MQPPEVSRAGRLRRKDTEEEKPKTETSTETMRGWSRTKSEKASMQNSRLSKARASACRHLGWADWAGGAALPASSGCLCCPGPARVREEAGVQGAGRGWATYT